MFLLNQKIGGPKVNKLIYFAIIIGLNFSLTSCSFPDPLNIVNSTQTIPINTISLEARRLAIANKKKRTTIYVTGKVIKVAPLLGKNAYQIQDDTGNIWVVTAVELPSVGQNIFIKCKIKSQNLSLISQETEELYLVEIERLDNS
ncbi:hypothetical protein Xen7305DRAFT_00010060 [Xenococcus sp. PCC 7305]|uniref:hypothetical protein n=1 Tax=Xenococcus sp. PCC 7305 TaxID=102125 RepID=UPI0002AC853E|nr:hypothetical protein [Xenococcus sp. PCC 7305]ELS01303.1 hypothetical protein Xen7305DRAFT_00010060 [Xenococcus sp. PCC 7305]